MLVNIRGTNGAGKSTIPLTMFNKDTKLRTIPLGVNSRGKPSGPYITLFPSYGWLALGSYFNKTGGMDTFKNNAMTRMALMTAIKDFPQYDILMEGIIASTIKSTYINWFKEIQSLSEDGLIEPIKILVVNFLPPVEVCIQRVLQRNDGKRVKEEQIRSKWSTVYLNSSAFNKAGIQSIKVDNSTWDKDKMLINFLKLTDKYREG